MSRSLHRASPAIGLDVADPPELAVAHERFLDLVKELRPELHRYGSRLVGSAIALASSVTTATCHI